MRQVGDATRCVERMLSSQVYHCWPILWYFGLSDFTRDRQYVCLRARPHHDVFTCNDGLCFEMLSDV